MAEMTFLKSGTFLPLFSFNTVIDTDLGLLNYIFKEFRNEDYFDLNVLDYMELINKVYYRNFDNPLYVIMKNPDSEEDKEFLDQCYQEFIESKEYEILDNSISTQILELLKIYKNEGNIQPTILYYTEAQFEYIKNTIDFDDFNIIHINEFISKSTIEYSQFYIKYVEELNFFCNVFGRTFYLSSCGLNLDENREDIKEAEIINDSIERGNQINVIDLYRTDIIGKDIYKYGAK